MKKSVSAPATRPTPRRMIITKTPKCYVGGAFIRSESARVFPLHDSAGAFVANIPSCTRKDLRNAVEIAAKAGPGWAKRSGYNRGQILYRLAEMIEARSSELAEAVSITTADQSAAAQEVEAAIDRIVHYAGWTDKYEQLLGSVNPVASPHFNFSTTEPVGVVGVLAPDVSPLLALLTMILPAIVSGNTVIALSSFANPYPAILLGEMLATSDLPAGVVNLLTGQRADLIPTFATHAQIRAVVAVASSEERKALQLGAAESVKRLCFKSGLDWHQPDTTSLMEIGCLIELKTTWHPVAA
jgi:acyl-CoA reductase-like NAD-dependent aldehyde dehydrogenase